MYNWTHGLTGLILGQVAACKYRHAESSIVTKVYY